MSPRGPIRAPRSPSAISAYSRSTCGGNTSAVDGTVTVRSPPQPSPATRALRAQTGAEPGGPGGGACGAGAASPMGADVWSPAGPVGESAQGNRHGRDRSGPGRASIGRASRAVSAGRRGTARGRAMVVAPGRVTVDAPAVTGLE